MEEGEVKKNTPLEHGTRISKKTTSMEHGTRKVKKTTPMEQGTSISKEDQEDHAIGAWNKNK